MTDKTLAKPLSSTPADSVDFHRFLLSTNAGVPLAGLHITLWTQPQRSLNIPCVKEPWGPSQPCDLQTATPCTSSRLQLRRQAARADCPSRSLKSKPEMKRVNCAKESSVRRSWCQLVIGQRSTSSVCCPTGVHSVVP